MFMLLSLSLVSAFTLTRTLPSSASDVFSVTYTVAGAPATYGVIIEDTVSGDCVFSDGTKVYKGVILSGDTGTLTTSITPEGPCIFTGVFSYSDGSTETDNVDLAQSTVAYTGTGTGSESFLKKYGLYLAIGAIILLVFFMNKK